VTRSLGLLNPITILAVAIEYLLTHRPQWPAEAAIGKTLVSSSLIDRVVASLAGTQRSAGGFKYFVQGLFDGSYCFGGKSRPGHPSASRRVGLDHRQGWADPGPAGGRDHCRHRARIRRALPGMTAKFGTPYYTRIDAPATPAQKDTLKKLSPENVTATTLAGETITARLTRAPGNNEPWAV